MSLKDLKNALQFASTLDFWKMSILWTFSLIISYCQLLYQNLFYRKSQSYPRCSPLNAAITRPVCIITGATSGLGAAAACALSKEGFFVVLVGRSSHLLSKVISDIQKQNKDAHLKAFEVDLSSYKSILNFKNYLQQWLHGSNLHSSIQLLINNAGILATSFRLTDEGHDQMMGTNYIGAFFLTKLLLPLLESSPVPSRIVNLSSFTHRAAYRLTKKLFLESAIRIQNIIHYLIYTRIPNSFSVKNSVLNTLYIRASPASETARKILSRVCNSPEDGICSVFDAALAPPETSGIYFFGGQGRTLNSSSLSYDTDLSKKLWEISSDLFYESQLAYRTKNLQLPQQ